MAKTQSASFQRGYSHGNFGNAYVTNDWDEFWANNCITPDGMDPKDYSVGCLLGFYSSYEVDEISDNNQAEAVHAHRIAYECDSDA